MGMPKIPAPAVAETSESGLVPSEDGQRWKTITFAIILLVLSIGAHFLLAYAHHEKWFADDWIETFQRLNDGIIVFAVAAILVETKPFKNYLEDRLRRIVEKNHRHLETMCENLVRSDFQGRATDLNYLRRFDAAFLDEAEDSMRRAAYAPNLPAEVEQFHRGLRSVRDQLDVWRADYWENIRIEEVAGHPDICRVVSESRWKYLNYSTEPITIEQAFSELSIKIPGIPDETLYHITSLSINGDDAMPRLRHGLRSPAHDKSKVWWEGKITVDLPPMTDAAQGITLRSESEHYRRRTHPYTLRFFRPVNGVRVTLHSLPDMRAELHAFSLGDSSVEALKPEPHYGDYYEWSHKNWFLPTQGVMLIFSHPSPAPAALPAGKAASQQLPATTQTPVSLGS